MKIGVVIGRIGGVDGVALETEKWIAVLERMGHQVCVVTGQAQGDVPNVTVLAEMAFDHPRNVDAQEKAFFGQGTDGPRLVADLEADAQRIEQGILRWIDKEGVECLVSANASSLPFHLTLGWAIKRVLDQTALPMVSHDHDFWWEREDRYETPYPEVTRLLEEAYPIRSPRVRHAVFNTSAKLALTQRLDIDDAVVVPMVMDFDEPFGLPDDFNEDLPQSLGLERNDIPLFQITRIVRRKGIETAIDLVHQLKDSHVKLVITGTAKDEHGDVYINELRERSHRLGLERQILFAGEQFDNHRRRINGRKIYSLSDGYAHAAACTYFSLYEAFGNAFVEAVMAKVPIFLNNYDPVYWADIGSLGFQTVQIEEGELTDKAVEQVKAVLADPQRQRDMAEHNFELGRRHFSYQALERILRQLFPPA